MLIVRQCWVVFLYCGLFAGIYSIRYEEDSNTTVQSRQLQSGFFPSDLNQNGNYNGNSEGNSNYNDNSGNYNGNYNGNSNYNYNTNNQYQGGNSLQFPSNDNQGSNAQFLGAQQNSVFNTGEYYAGDQPIQYQNNLNEVRPGQIPNRENNEVQYFAYQDQDQPTFTNTKPPITTYYQPNNPVPFQPNLQNASPSRPFPVTQRPIGPFQRPQRPLGPVNNIPQPQGNYQQNYAGNFNNYQATSNPISNFISNIGQGAADFFSGGTNSNYYNRPNAGPFPPQQFDSFNRPIRPNGNGIRPPPGPFGTIEQLGKAIDEITRNDDFQCIPKVICQMFGNQRQQSTYSSILGSPIFSGLIAAVPSSSAGLVYGRAALLGYTSGESTCNGAYPKCPKNENDLLYYLNNHRGGFFRFFNGGATFGDDSNYNYNQNQNNQYSQNYNQNYNQQPSTPQQSTLTNLAALQNLAEVINQSDGINLSNIASNGGLLNNLAGLVGGNGGGTADLLSGLIGGNGAGLSGASSILNSLGGALGNSQSGGNNGGAISLLSGLAQDGGSNANIGSVVGNLLTGFIGNRFSSRKISKRSVLEDEFGKAMLSQEAENKDNDENESNESSALKEDTEKRLNDSDDANSTHELWDSEPRIVHGKLPILSISNKQPSTYNIKFTDKNTAHEEKQIKFTDEPQTAFREEKQITFSEGTSREEKQIKFIENSDSKKSFFIFPSNGIGEHNENIIFPISNDAFRIPKQIKFLPTEKDPTHFFPINNDHQSFNEINDTPQRIKMVFPDRTGTGNLIFDNNQFDTAGLRIGKILSGLRVLQQLQAQQLNGNTNQILFDATNSNRYDGNSNYNANTLQGLTQSNDRYQQSLPNRYTTNQQANNHRFGNQNYNINYNSQSTYNNGANRGDDSSQNVYITNGKGVVEYYINSAGVKVYV